jgi:glycosyltransferase involved in cell wall biosynthesis
MKKITFIILTYNNEKTILNLLNNLKKVNDSDILVVDSFSTDKTCEILIEENITFKQNSFLNYSQQRNFSLSNLEINSEFVFCIDSDELLDTNLINWINTTNITALSKFDGYYLVRKVIFMGKFIRFGGVYPTYHMRLFKKQKGQCEDKTYDQHFYVNGKVTKIKKGAILDPVMSDLESFISSHNRWSSLEKYSSFNESKHSVKANLFGNAIERRRYYKKIFVLFPNGYRGAMLFIVKYFFLLGFLDGYKGFLFHFFNSFWFRTLVDAKIYENKSLNN